MNCSINYNKRDKINSIRNEKIIFMKMFGILTKTLQTRLSLFFFSILLSGNAFTQDTENLSISNSNSSGSNFSNSFNVCPFSAAFGLYSGNYEHLFDGTHGVVTRFDYESISDSYSNNPVELNGFGFILNYRYHLSGSMESIFIGSYARYRIYEGNGVDGITKFDFNISEWSFGLNAGKRWVWDNGFNVTFALGYGFSTSSRETNPNTSTIRSTINAFENEYTFFGPFLGELSVGYAF